MNSPHRLRTAAGALLLAAVAGCSRPVDVRHPITVSMAIITAGMHVEVLADDVAVRDVRQGTDALGQNLKFEVHGVVDGKTHRIPALKLRILDNCGSRDYPLTLSQHWTADEVRSSAQVGRPVEYSADFPMIPGALNALWVDTRGGKGGELRVGALRIQVSSGAASRYDIRSCEKPVTVAFNDASLGEIPAVPADAPRADLQGTVWIDPSGRHCYKHYQVRYGLPEMGGGESKPQLWAGRKIYVFHDVIPYVFENPPGSVYAPSNSFPAYEVLKDARCR